MQPPNDVDLLELLFRYAPEEAELNRMWRLAVDTALEVDLTSVRHPVWQAAVAVRLAVALRPLSLEISAETKV